MDPIFKDKNQMLLNGAVYHAKSYDFFYNKNYKRAEKSLAILQFYKEFVDVTYILRNYAKMDVERLKPKETRILHPADRMVLSL